MFPLWEGSNSRVFLLFFFLLSFSGREWRGRREGELEVRKAGPWWLQMPAAARGEDTLPLPLSELHARGDV